MSLKSDALPPQPAPAQGLGTARPGLAHPHPAHLAGLPQAGARLGPGPGSAPPDAGSVVRWSAAALAQPPLAVSPLAGHMAWPSAGLGAQAQAQAVQLWQALSLAAPTIPKPLLPLSAQAWSPAFLAQWLADSNASGAAQPPLFAWAAQQVQVQTPAGQHSLFMRLMLPFGRLAGEAPAASPSASSKGGGAAVLRWSDSPLLTAGALAWVLAPEDQAALSALLVLEWGPRRDAMVYGKDPGLGRHDPWLLHAQWLATGVKERPGSAVPNAPLCDTPDCPYRGQAACPQPFCPATGAVASVDAV